MNAVEFRAWVKPLLRRTPRTEALSYFLSLPSALELAAGPSHFLETAASSAKGLGRVKLALILETPPPRLAADAAARANPRKAVAAADVLSTLAFDFGMGYDAGLLPAMTALLQRWRLSGSLMISVDFDRSRGRFDKLSFYAYMPEGALGELLRAFGAERLLARLAPLVERNLEFWALDLRPDGGADLKFYNREPYRPEDAPPGLRAAAARLASLCPVRDLTRLTRVRLQNRRGRRGAPRLEPGSKAYFGFREGIGLSELAALRPAAFRADKHRALARALAKHAPGQRAYFLGFDGGDLEAYFDRRVRVPEPEETSR